MQYIRRWYQDTRSDDDFTTLQTDINNLYHWSIDWGLKFNPQKCQILFIKRSQTIDNLQPPIFTRDWNNVDNDRITAALNDATFYSKPMYMPETFRLSF